MQAWCHALDMPGHDSSILAYYQARLRLSVECLRTVHASLVQKLARRISEADLWLGHAVKVIDGCGVSMPDSAARIVMSHLN
jgi:hypothetical protein